VWAGIILGIVGGLTTVVKMVVFSCYSILTLLSKKVTSKSCGELSQIAFGSLLNCIDALLNCVVGFWNSFGCYQIKIKDKHVREIELSNLPVTKAEASDSFQFTNEIVDREPIKAS
jgi:hypothetical protein